MWVRRRSACGCACVWIRYNVLWLIDLCRKTQSFWECDWSGTCKKKWKRWVLIVNWTMSESSCERNDMLNMNLLKMKVLPHTESNFAINAFFKSVLFGKGRGVMFHQLVKFVGQLEKVRASLPVKWKRWFARDRKSSRCVENKYVFCALS